MRQAYFIIGVIKIANDRLDYGLLIPLNDKNPNVSRYLITFII